MCNTLRQPTITKIKDDWIAQFIKQKNLINGLIQEHLNEIQNKRAYMINFKINIFLRGGGCGNTKIPQVKLGKLQDQFPPNFAMNLKLFTDTISEKSFLFQDKLHQDEVLSAFQWFYNNKEYFQIICNDDSINSKFYHLIEKSAEILLKSLIVYIKLSGFLFHQLLEICNDLFRVIFSYQLKNEERYMQESLKQSLLEIITEIESQMSVESMNIQKSGVEQEIQLIKTCLAHCRTNSEQEKEIVISILCGAASSISELKPSEELINSLIEAGKFLLLNFYDKQIQHPLQKYEIYYFFENLKWSIIHQLKLGFSVQKTINPLIEGYNLYIKQSQDWMIHACWIKFISDLMAYRPVINKIQIYQTYKSEQIIWNQLILTNQIIQLPYDKSSGKLQIFGKKNSLLLKQFKQLILFQEYLLDIQEQFYLFPAYSHFQFDNQLQGQVDNDEFLIKLLLSESTLETISILNNFLKTSSEELTNHFDSINQQYCQTNKFIYSSKVNDRIQRDDISYMIKQIKIHQKSLFFNLYELNILVNQDREYTITTLNILKQNQQFFKENTLKSQIILLQKINQLEEQYTKNYQVNVEKFPSFFIQIFHQLSLYQVDSFFTVDLQNINFKEIHFDQKQFIETVQNLNKFLEKYISDSKSIKQQFSKICISKEIKNYFDQKISLKDQSQTLINIYNLNMIQKLAREFYDQYSKFESQQNITNNTQVDLRLNLLWCNQIIKVLQIFKMLFELQQKKILSLKKQSQDGISKEICQDLKESFNYNNIKSFLENLIAEKKALFLNLLNENKEIGYQVIELNNLQEISLSINEGIDAIQQQNWPDDFKQIQILVFQEVKNKIQILELLKKNQKQLILEILQLFDRQKESLSQEKQLDQSQIQLMSKTNEKIQSQNQTIFDLLISQNLFNWEEQNQQIQDLLQSVKKIQTIIKQKNSNFQQTQVQFSKAIYEIIGDSFNKNFIEIYSDMSTELNNFLIKICEQKQTIFNDSFQSQLSEKPYFTQMLTLQIIFQDSQSFLQQNLISNQEQSKEKAYTFMLEELKKENCKEQGNDLAAIFEESSYKVREAVVFNLIKLQSIIQEFAIQDFCQNILKQIWMIEKHTSVRNILKNKEMIEMQKQLFSKDLSNFTNKLKIEMQNKLKKLEQLETQVLISENKVELKNQLQQAYEDFETYLDNVSDMSQKMDISLIFLREIRKDLKSIKSSIDQILLSMKGIEDDLRRLSGKDFRELLQIRKDKILKQKQEAELDQVHIQFNTQEFDPLTGKKKDNGFGNLQSHLISKQYNNYEGEVNEFLWSDGEQYKDVMLLKGKAGSGKSRASRNIEEFLWINELTTPQWIPIFVSLPSLKNPKHNLIEQALESQNYNFDKIQIREFKEAIINGNLKVVFILESYDEMQIELIQTNLYQTNRFSNDLNLQISGQNVKFIITTREEILTTIGYQTWFYGKNLETLKEVELLPFNYDQSSEYIKQYSEVSVKRTVKKYYEFLKQLKSQNFSLNEFKFIWNSLDDCINIIINQKQDQDMLFQSQDVDKIIQKLLTIEFFNYIRADQMIQLRKELLQLWSQQKFSQVINNVSINHLMSTPFMMEIIVYVLPKMSSTFSESNFLRETLKQKYFQLKKESFKQDLLIEKYQSKRNIVEATDVQLDQDELSQKIDKKLLEHFFQLIEELESQNFFENYSISYPIDFLDNNRIMLGKVYNVTNDANFIVSAFKLNQLTAYDFYETFSQFYHMQQLQKWKELGKTFNYDTTLIDLHDFSMYLALDMTTYELVQVDYKQKGILSLAQALQEGKKQGSWEDQYFDQNQPNSEYYDFLKKCMLLRARGTIHSFSHKSIQEFFVAKYIFNLLNKVFVQESNCILIKNSRFNQDQFNISLDHFQGAIELLKSKLKQILDIKNKLILIIQSSEDNLVRTQSNIMYLLCSLKENLNNTHLSNICLSNTKLNGLNFFECNLNNTRFNKVSIDSCNFNCATIQNAIWENLICKEKPTLIGLDQITSIQFTKDGQNLISGSKDGNISIWQVSEIKQLKRFQLSNDAQVISTSLSEETSLLACLSNHSIQLFNSKELKLENYQPLINYDYKKVMLSSDGQYIAALTQTLKIYFWKIQSLQNQCQTQNQIFKLKFKIKCLAISQSTKLLAIGGSQVIILSINNLSEQQQIASLPNTAQSLAFSLNEQILAVADENNNINFWNLINKNQIEIHFSIQLSQVAKKLQYSSNGQYFILRDDDSIILFQTAQIISKLDLKRETIYKNYSKKPWQKDFDISKNSQFLAIATTQGIIIHNLESNQIITTIEQEDEYNQVQFAQDDELLIFSASWNRLIQVYNVKNIDNMIKLQTITLPFKTLQVCYLQNSKQLLIRNTQFLTLHSLQNCEYFKMIQIQKSDNYSNFILINQDYFGIIMDDQICFKSLNDTVDVDFILNYEKNELLHNKFCSDGITFSVIYNRDCYTKYNIQTRKIIKQEKLQVNKIKSIFVNNQETLCIIIQKQENGVKLLLFDLQLNKAIQNFEDSKNTNHSCILAQFFPDGFIFVTGYSNGLIKLWDTKTCKLLSMFQSNTSSINLISISKQGILAQVNQRKIQLWNTKALLQQQFEIDDHSDSIQCFAISPDGLQLISSSNSEIIRYDLQDLKQIDVLLRASNLPSIIQFSQDSRYFAALDQDNQINIWKINTKYIIERRFKLLFSPCINFTFQNNLIISQHVSKLFLTWNLDQISQKLVNYNNKLKNQLLETNIFSPNLKFYVSNSPFQIVNIGQNKNQEKIESPNLNLQSKLGVISISKDSTKIAFEDLTIQIIIWSLLTKQQIAILKDEETYDFTILSMTFSGDSKLLFSIHADEFYRIWNLCDNQTTLIQKTLLMESLQCFSLSVIQVHSHKIDDFLILWSQKQIQESDEYEQLCFSYHKVKEPKILQSNLLTESDSYEGYEERKNFLINFSVAYSENKQLLAVQRMTYLTVFDLVKQEEMFVFEGNSLRKSNISTILLFINDDQTLLGLGRDHILRYWDFKGNIKINLKQKVPAKAFHYNKISQFIKVLGQDNLVYQYLIEDFTEICQFSNIQSLSSQESNNNKSTNIFDYQIEDQDSICINIIDKSTKEVKYFLLNQFSSEINCLIFSRDQKHFILGMKDGSVWIYTKIDKFTEQKYGKLICVKVFGKSPLLQTDSCNVNSSKFFTLDNENLIGLFMQKGAISSY
ncbi:unnamed protein product [Paramecium sonneborni]|uniref:Uncharacterized protein n=1 Tax=Paramecium sonneborni TaxID=65129 RepID=A0A8S1QD57_9CILI|nr:unnamed protein product [Paramecium sonneborni]